MTCRARRRAHAFVEYLLCWRLRRRPQIWQDGRTMGTANLYLGVAWLGLGGFLFWDAWQSGSGRLEPLLGGVCILVAIGNFVFWKRLRPKQ